MISSETRVQIRHWFYAEHWKLGTIAQELGVHPDTVRSAIESNRFHRAQTLRPCLTDPYLPFIRQTLDLYPRLRATRIYQMLRERGYQGSVVQLRRAVANLRPQRPEPFLRLHMFPAELFPTSRFRMAFDELKDKLGPRGSKEYLAILELAAKESEAKVDEALRGLLEKGEGWVRAEAVRERLGAERKGSVREVHVASVDL